MVSPLYYEAPSPVSHAVCEIVERAKKLKRRHTGVTFQRENKT